MNDIIDKKINAYKKKYKKNHLTYDEIDKIITAYQNELKRIREDEEDR